MKPRNVFVLLVVVFLIAPIQRSYAAPIINKFEAWGKINGIEKLGIYIGWTNGFFQGRGEKGLELGECVERMSYDQAIAMIDKRYKDHPEFWSKPLGEEILDALTMKGGPCEGKSLFPED